MLQVTHKWILTAAVTIMVAALASQPLIAGQSPFASALNPMHAPTASTMSFLTINATGHATAIGNAHSNAPVNVTLILNGTISTNSGGQLKISVINGTLRIGNQNYTLVSGRGVENGKGMVEIHALTSNGQELILHGTVQGNTATFTAPQSKLASLYFLSLQGPVTHPH